MPKVKRRSFELEEADGVDCDFMVGSLWLSELLTAADRVIVRRWLNLVDGYSDETSKRIVKMWREKMMIKGVTLTWSEFVSGADSY